MNLRFVDPPAITAVEVTEVCTNDFTISWTAASNEEELSYNVMLSLLNISVNSLMDSSYNFTGLMPATSYVVNVFSMINNCLGIPNTTVITTLTVEAGVPQSALVVVNMYIPLLVFINLICIHNVHVCNLP